MPEHNHQYTICTPDGLGALKQELEVWLDGGPFDSTYHAIRAAEKNRASNCKDLETTNPDLFVVGTELLAKAKWYVFDRLVETEMVELMKGYTGYVFDFPFDAVVSKVRLGMTLPITEAGRRDLQQQLASALAESTTAISDGTVQLSGSNEASTIHNWIQDFRNTAGDRDLNSLMVIEYLSQASVEEQLDDAGDTRLEHILKLYIEILKPISIIDGPDARNVVANPVTGKYEVYQGTERLDISTDIPMDELEQLRFVANLDHHGKPLSIQEQILSDPALTPDAFENYQKIIDRKKTQSERTSAVYAKPRVVESARQPAAQPTQTTVAPSTPTPQLKSVGTPGPLPVEPLPMPQPPADLPIAPSHAPTPRFSEQSDSVAATASGQSADQAYTDGAKHILNQYKLLLASGGAERRFISLVASFLRGVRNSVELHDALVRPAAEGGVDLPAAQADAIVDSATDYQNNPPSAQPMPAANQLTPAASIPSFADVQKHIQAHETTQPTIDESQVSSPVSDIFGEIHTGPMADVLTEHSRKRQSHTPPQTISDITAKASDQPGGVFGPIEELAAITPIEFRRLSNNPDAAGQKIINKINLLEADSISKKAEGIQAWQSSPLNQLYVEIGSTSLEQGKVVEDVLKDRAEVGQDTLTPEEFDAVADINSHLRF